MDDESGVRPYEIPSGSGGGGSAGQDRPAARPQQPVQGGQHRRWRGAALVIVMGKNGFRIGSTAYVTLQYVHLGTGLLGFTANGQVFSFLFSDLQPKLLTVHGRNLLRMYHHIGLRRIAWIRQTDRDFRLVGDDADEPVITRIDVSNWKRPKEEQEAALAEEMD